MNKIYLIGGVVALLTGSYLVFQFATGSGESEIKSSDPEVRDRSFVKKTPILSPSESTPPSTSTSEPRSTTAPETETDHVNVLPQPNLKFSSLSIGQRNRGTVNINGYVMHFAITLPPAYDSSHTYSVVLYFHGCMCTPKQFDDMAILSYLDTKRLSEGFINV